MINALNFLSGFSIGYNFTQVRTSEEAIAQGENDYVTILPKTEQLNLIGTLLSKNFPSLKFIGEAISNPLIVYPSLGFCAVAKNKWNVRVLTFINDHVGSMCAIAMTVITVALAIFGQHYFAGAIFSSLLIRTLNSYRVIPPKINLYLEAYAPLATDLYLIAIGNIFTKIFNAAGLCSSIFSSKIFQYKILEPSIDVCLNLISTQFRNLPTLKEIETSKVEKKHLSFDEIKTIIESSDNSYEFHPAHYVQESIALPKDDHLDSLMCLFDQVNWSEKHNVIKRKLQDDDQFIKFIKKSFPDDENLKSDYPFANKNISIDTYLERLAEKSGISPTEYTTQRIRETMQIFIDVVTRKRKGRGSEETLMTAIEYTMQILSYLHSLPPADKDFENVLLELAVKAGDYCNLGLSETAEGLVQRILSEKELHVKLPSGGFVHDAFERRIRQSLHFLRCRILESAHQQSSMFLPKIIANDLHIFTSINSLFGLGFVFLPCNKNPTDAISFIFWKIFHAPLRSTINKIYRGEYIKTINADIGVSAISEYMLQLIRKNDRLLPDQKELLEELATDPKYWQGFYRWMLVALGVLKHK